MTTTIGNQNPNAPSADVQEQSAGFVQQNQQAQRGQSASGIAVPIGGTGDPRTSADKSSGSATGSGNNPKDAAAVAAVPVPVVPPPPPPTYESTMRRLDRKVPPSTPPAMTIEVSGPAAAVRKPDVTVKSAEPAPPPSPPAKKPGVPPSAPHATGAVAETAAERVPAPPPAVTGGRGEAPDGFTFYSGLAIAGALLAFALATFLRMGRNEGNR